MSIGTALHVHRLDPFCFVFGHPFYSPLFFLEDRHRNNELLFSKKRLVVAIAYTTAPVEQYYITCKSRFSRFFFDFVKRAVPDNPVVLNTGDIVDEDTAKNLVQHQAQLPNGRVTGFFSSFSLKSLLGVLVDEEIEQHKQMKLE